MKSKNALFRLSIAVVLQLGVLAASAQTNIYLFSGSKTNITLNPGTYIITAYGAPGGGGVSGASGGLGAEMSGEFNFSTSTNLTLLVGGGASSVDTNYYYGYGGGGGSFVVNGSTPMVIAGGGGGGPGDGNGYGGNGNVSRNLPRRGFPPGYGGPGGGGGDDVNFATYSSGGGGGGGGFLFNGLDGDTGGIPPDNHGYFTGGGGGFSFQNGGGGGIASDYGGGNGGYGGGGSGGGFGSYFGPGGGGGGGGYTGGSGGTSGGSGGGNGGFSIIDSSAIANLTEVSGILSPDDPYNGEIIITAVPTPLLITAQAAFGFTNGVFGFNVTGPSGSNVVIQASTDLQTWIPLQTNLLGSGPLYFSDPQSATNVRRFYRTQLLP
jgi:Glycine rich protein